MKNNKMFKILSLVICLISIITVFTSCSEKEAQPTEKKTKISFNELEWTIEPCIEAEKISALISPVFNDYTNHYDFNISKYCVVKKDGKCGLIDMYGCNITNSDYDEIFAIRDGDDFIGKIGSAQTYIHSDSLQTESAYRTYNTKKYEYYYNVNNKKQYFVKNTSGDKTILDYNSVLPEAVIGVDNSELKENGKFGLYVDGKEITGMIYSAAGYFNDGVVAFKKGDKWGYVDSTGKIVIPFELDAVKGYNAFSGEDTPYESSEGIITACKDGKFAFYTNDGKQLCDFVYDDATPCINGRIYAMSDGKWGIISLVNYDKTEVASSVSSTEISTTVTTVSDETTETQEDTTADVQNESKKYVVDTDTLYLRADIGSESIISILDEDDVVYCDKTNGEWAHLVFDEYDGWVKLEYLKEVE